MSKRSVALNIFTPNAETDDPAAFAGRQQYILDLTDALMVAKSVPVIYGERGLGKTSLALQVARIALGDVTLLHEYRHSSRALDTEDRYTVFWLSCSDAATKTTSQILQRLINTAEGYSSLSELQQRLSATESKTKLNLRFFEKETSRKYEERGLGHFADLDIEDKVSATIDALQKAGDRRLLFIIDELDRVASTDGLANFLKNTSARDVKFILVGIGHTISSLLADHESLSRSLVPVKVGVMTAEELHSVLLKASHRLAAAEIGVSFSVAARQRIVEAAAGFPWFVHLLGQATLMDALDSKAEQVSTVHVELAINNLARNRFAQHFGDLYQKAVGDSPQREIVLRLMAKWRAVDVPASEIYPLAEGLGVSNPPACRTQLLRERSGRVLVTPPDRGGAVQFRNAMFKRYCDLRSAVFQGIKEKVDTAWAAQHPS